MKIAFDNSIKLAGLGMVPWNRLGPEQWLTNYVITSLYGWNVPANAGVPPVYALSDYTKTLPKLKKINTQQLLLTKEFQELLDTQLPGYDLLTYKPVEIPESLKNRKFLMVDPEFTKRYENKASFRRMFGKSVKFPEYKIINRASLNSEMADYQSVMDDFEAVVMQDVKLSGGKGTFFIDSFEKYTAALEALNRMSDEAEVVVSCAVPHAKERTIQAVVTGDQIFTGPLQRQIVGHPLLANTNIPDGDKFCGASILEADQNTTQHQTAVKIAKQIGSKLQKEGYRGIFGIDFLQGTEGELYTLEINPRVTGVTPLLSALYKAGTGVPFYLLHLLELGSYSYEISDSNYTLDKFGSLMILHSLANEKVRVEKAPPSGTYTVKDGKLILVSENVDLANLKDDEYIVQDTIQTGMDVKPGARFVTVQTKQSVLDEKTDELYNSTVLFISLLREQIITKSII